MLSILIPVYNSDVTTLVTALHKQCSNIDIDYEIICIDDGSESQYKSTNQACSKFQHVIYKELESNIGRAAIRALLAKTAQYDRLLLLDCDVEITSDMFIKNYLNHQSCPIVIGGVSYSKTPPKDPNHKLRWEYGRQREQRPANDRQNSKHAVFLASNLLIDKSLFLQFETPKDIQGYGHEDTWLGIQLRKNGIAIKHIANEVEHLGLDNTEVFLRKTKSGLLNLARLHKKGVVNKEIRLVALYEKLRQFGLISIAKLAIAIRLNAIEKNLYSAQPSLNLFDQWKFYWFIVVYSELKTLS
jgi:glycosyltransferase involved in cell wall biosynthesis